MILHIETGKENPILRKKSLPVPKITKQIKKLVKHMEETMTEDNKGIGLAAPQVGQHVRVILITLFSEGKERDRDDGKIIAMINPEITAYSMDTKLGEEGCLSLPGQFFKVERYKEVEVEFMDMSGSTRKMRLAGLNAREVQHEIDHLDGVLFTDYLDKEFVPVMRKEKGKLEIGN